MEPNFHFSHSWPVATLPGGEISHNKHEAPPFAFQSDLMYEHLHAGSGKCSGLLAHSWYATSEGFDRYHSLFLPHAFLSPLCMS